MRHSQKEKRFYALGETAGDKMLFVSFAIKRQLIRVISARDVNPNERDFYGKQEAEKDSSISD